MSEKFARRRGRLAAAKVEPVNGQYVAFASPKFVEYVREMLAETKDIPAKKKRGRPKKVVAS